MTDNWTRPQPTVIMILDSVLEQLSTSSEQFRLRNFTHKAWWNDSVVYKHFTTQPQARQADVIITNRLSTRTQVRCLVKYRTFRMKPWHDLKYISLRPYFIPDIISYLTLLFMQVLSLTSKTWSLHTCL